MQEIAKPADYDAVVVINLCVPTASGVPLDRLPREIDGVRIIGIDVPGFGVPTHAEAKDVLAGAMLRYARLEAEQGPVQRPRQMTERRRTVSLHRRDVPGRPGRRRRPAGPDGPLGRAADAGARVARPLRRARLLGRRPPSIPFYTASVREFMAAGRPVVGSGPVGLDGTAAWLDAIGKAADIARRRSMPPRPQALPAIRAALDANRLNARVTVVGLRGLGTAGGPSARRSRRRGALRRAPPARAPNGARPTGSGSRRAARMSSTAPRSSRTSPPCGRSGPTSPSARRRWCRRPRSSALPAIYFTNMVSARPLFGAGRRRRARPDRRHPDRRGATASPAWCRSSRASARASRPATAGRGVPESHPGAKERYRKMREAKARAEAHIPVGT